MSFVPVLRSRLAPTLLLVALVVSGLAVAAPAATAATRSHAHGIAPVIDDNFADPDILVVKGVYYAYATNNEGQNVQLRTSRDLKHWTRHPDVAPVLGDWVGPCSFAPGGPTDNCVWAPRVEKVAGGYALYYTARDATSPRQCIGVATSTSPLGPFKPVGSEPLVCPNGENGTTDLGGAIDAGTYSENGQQYLLWKADGNCCEGKTAIIYLQKMSADGRTLTGPPVELIRRDQPYEGNVVEAPTLLKRHGTYYLFYSANDFFGANYRTAYATSSTLEGPYTKAKTELMTTDRFQERVRGPGGQAIFPNRDGSTSIAFHGWDPTYTYRAMYVSTLAWSADGVPSVTAASTRYQAEDGILNDARPVADDTASGLAKVGGMDNPGSSGRVRVRAHRSGPQTVGIRYANGSQAADGTPVRSTDTLTVNGRRLGTLTFAHTTWGNWQVLERRVSLKKGWNTVTLTRGTYFAEIDAVDLFRYGLTEPPAYPPANVSDGVTYEAEEGTVTHARVVDDPSASAGAKVGGMDFADSSVSLKVLAKKSGRANLDIRFANGSERGGYLEKATDAVTVNGRNAGTVTFPHTRWGNWTTIRHQVKLKKGLNTVTLTRKTFYAELDSVVVR
jgi:arabinan endo-1,5-alpha-L-arabinosidase